MNNKIKLFYLLLIGESDHWIIAAFIAALVGKIAMKALVLLVFIATDDYGASAFSGHMTHDFGRYLFVFVISDPPFESFIVIMLVIITKYLKRKFSALFVGFVNIPCTTCHLCPFQFFRCFSSRNDPTQLERQGQNTHRIHHHNIRPFLA